MPFLRKTSLEGVSALHLDLLTGVPGEESVYGRCQVVCMLEPSDFPSGERPVDLEMRISC